MDLGRYAGRLRRALHGGLERALGPCTPPPGWEVLPEDWVAALDGFRRYLGYPPYEGPLRYPTLEELEEWERTIPGCTATWRRIARIQSELRFLRSLRERGA